MSIATDKLESGRQAIVALFGEAMTWIPASSVVKAESGEVVTDEDGQATIIDETGAIDFNANFDDAYQVLNGMEIASTGPAAVDVKESDLPDADRGDLVVRESVYYFVMDVQRDGRGGMVLILSKHAH